MWEMKTVLIAAALLVAVTGFCIYQLNSDKKVGHPSEIKSESPCEKAYKKYYLNGGDCFNLMDEDFVGCNCTWLYGEKQCEKYMWYQLFKICCIVKFLIQNKTSRKKLDSKTDKTKKFDSKSDKKKKLLYKIMLFRKTFLFKILLLRKCFFYSKSCFLEKVF